MKPPDPALRTIGILGVGRVGAAVARQSLKAGFEVKIATAKPAKEIALIADIVIPGATPVDAAEAVTADLVVIAVPLHKFRTLDPKQLLGKTVIDVMNYWAPIDGELEDFAHDSRTSSEIVQEFLNGAALVKTLNHIGYPELEEDGKPPDCADRRALGQAGDDLDAKHLVAALIDRRGYDAVDAGPLSTGRAFQPGTEIFNGSHNATQLRELLAAATQPAYA